MNSPVYKFILKAISVFVIWYLVYELWLLPNGVLDEWVSLNIIRVSGGLLSSMGFEVYTVNRIIGIGENTGIEIVNGCNGISAMGLFLGFIIAYPGEWKERFSFCIIGVSVIYVANIFRIISLSITQAYEPQYFNFMHEYSTSTMFYLIIFILWMIWVRINPISEMGNFKL